MYLIIIDLGDFWKQWIYMNQGYLYIQREREREIYDYIIFPVLIFLKPLFLKIALINKYGILMNRLDFGRLDLKCNFPFTWMLQASEMMNIA